MVCVSSTMWSIKNQPSNSTSCSDSALRLLVLVAGRLYWGLQVKSSFSIWGCVMKGWFERGIFWRPKSRSKRIEDFNPEHWPPLADVLWEHDTWLRHAPTPPELLSDKLRSRERNHIWYSRSSWWGDGGGSSVREAIHSHSSVHSAACVAWQHTRKGKERKGKEGAGRQAGMAVRGH